MKGCRRLATAIVAPIAMGPIAGCGVEPRDSITAPASTQAADIAQLWQLSLWLGIAVWTIVIALLAVPLVRSWRRAAHPSSGHPRSRPAPPGAEIDEPLPTADPEQADEAQRDRSARGRLIWLGGIVAPAVVLLVLLVESGRVGLGTAHVEREGELVIDVVGHMFWWEVRYPDEGVVTANEIHVPVDRPVRLNLTTADVIHSFWIPRVHGKVDMIPGTENQLTFVATETGRFRGHCAEFCGIAHAQMVAFLVVQEPDEFHKWVAARQVPAADPGSPLTVEGQRVFIQAGCAACHAVRGTAAIGGAGPDLTHLASRRSLAAGIVENSRENLAELIVDPRDVKPGITMPPTGLEAAELESLLDYLESLE